jgi:hypothetical protein
MSKSPICGRSECEEAPKPGGLYCKTHDPAPYVKPKMCMTVGEVIEHLKSFPPDFPVAQSMTPGVIVVHFNHKQEDAHVAFEEDDGCFDDVPGTRGARGEDEDDDDIEDDEDE